jgi:hypothetical protein
MNAKDAELGDASVASPASRRASSISKEYKEEPQDKPQLSPNNRRSSILNKEISLPKDTDLEKTQVSPTFRRSTLNKEAEIDKATNSPINRRFSTSMQPNGKELEYSDKQINSPTNRRQTQSAIYGKFSASSPTQIRKSPVLSRDVQIQPAENIESLEAGRQAPKQSSPPSSTRKSFSSNLNLEKPNSPVSQSPETSRLSPKSTRKALVFEPADEKPLIEEKPLPTPSDIINDASASSSNVKRVVKTQSEPLMDIESMSSEEEELKSPKLQFPRPFHERSQSISHYSKLYPLPSAKEESSNAEQNEKHELTSVIKQYISEHISQILSSYDIENRVSKIEVSMNDAQKSLADINQFLSNIENSSRWKESIDLGLKSHRASEKSLSSKYDISSRGMSTPAVTPSEHGHPPENIDKITELKRQRDMSLSSKLLNRRFANMHSQMAILRSEMKRQECRLKKNSQKQTDNILKAKERVKAALSKTYHKQNSKLSILQEAMKIKSTELERVIRQCQKKADVSVIEELAKHLGTKEDIKALKSISIPQSIDEQLSKKVSHIFADFTQLDKENENLNIKALKDWICKKVKEEVKMGIKALPATQSELIQTETFSQTEYRPAEKDFAALKDKIAIIEQELKIQTSKIDQSKIINAENTAVLDEDLINHNTARQITKQFDEKLYRLCSELSACRALQNAQLSQPYYRCAQWIWNCSTLKHGSAVPWNIETVNTDTKNIFWEPNCTKLKIQEAGLYEIKFAFFTKCRPSIQLLVNGESVMSAINSPSYVVHHSPGFVLTDQGKLETGAITGLSLVVYLDYLGLFKFTEQIFNFSSLSRR